MCAIFRKMFEHIWIPMDTKRKKQIGPSSMTKSPILSENENQETIEMKRRHKKLR